jgi:hypothetical protein
MNSNEHGVEEHLRADNSARDPIQQPAGPQEGALLARCAYFNPTTLEYPPAQDWNDGTQSVWAGSHDAGRALPDRPRHLAQPPVFSGHGHADLEIAVLEAFCTKVKAGILCHGPLLGWHDFCGDEFVNAWACGKHQNALLVAEA